MTKIDLWKQPEFGVLFRDPRFRSILDYLKTEVPARELRSKRSGDWWEGFHQTIVEIESLGVEPKLEDKKDDKQPRQLYGSGSTINEPSRAI